MLHYQGEATAQQLSDKFKNDEGALTFSFGGLNTFFGGLEGLVGTPNPALRETMEAEHCTAMDSTEWFEVRIVPRRISLTRNLMISYV